MKYLRKNIYLTPHVVRMLAWLVAHEDEANDSLLIRELIRREYERRGGPPIPKSPDKTDAPADE